MDQMTGEPSETGAAQGPRRDRISRRSAVWLAWGLWLLVILLEVLGFALKLANDSLSTREWLGHHLTAAPFLAFATVGAVIITHRPGNRIGWLCWAIGAPSFSASLAARRCGRPLPSTQAGRLPGRWCPS